VTGRIVLLLATAASVAYFVRTTLRRLEAAKTARADLAWDHLPARLGRVFREVILQQRVLANRPLAGLLHALVMWGFFAFAWVSVEHFTQGLVGLDAAQPESSWYDAFAGAWAAAVLVGIVGLAYRRFVVRPQALGEPSSGSAMVAALIVALMATYLAGWLALEPPSAAWQANWWLHTAALLGMLWLIPNSKHLHLLLGPVAIFFRRGDTISPTRALVDEDDDDFGLMRLSDLSQKDILDVNACVECGRCTDVCPANQAGGSLSPKHVILQLQKGLLTAPNLAAANAAGTAAEVAAGEAWVSEDDLYQCFSCGACEQACPVGIEHVGPKILDLRRGLVSEGRTEHPKLNDLFQTMERAPHNGWGASQQVRRKLLDEAALPIFDGSQDWLLWMGCGCNYDPHGQDVVRAMQKLLDAAGQSWGVLSQETCCGEPARRAGNEYLAMELSEKVIDALASAKARNVVTADPHCCRMLDVDYRQNPRYAELGIRVVHHTELLEELRPRLTLEGVDERVAYHDPCWLARGRGVTDAPRSALEAAGADLIEPASHGRNTACCGAGGAQLFLADDRKEWPGGRVNDRRLAQLTETGAKTVAVGCPYCQIMLSDAAGRSSAGEVQIVDVAELMASRLPESHPESQ